MVDKKQTKQTDKKQAGQEQTKLILKIEAVCDSRIMKLTNGKKLVFDKAGDIKEVDAPLAAKYTMIKADGETIIKPGAFESFRIV